MPDLMPNTSFYNHPQQSLGDLLGAVRGVRDLQEQQAIGQATKDNTDPNTGMLNVPAATKQYLDTAGNTARPDRIGAISDAAGKVYQQRQGWMTDALGAVESTITDPKASPEKFAATIAPKLVKAGVPADIVNEAARAAPGQSFKNYLIQIQQWLSKNGALPTVKTIDPGTGQEGQRTPGSIYFDQAPMGGGGKNVTVKAGGMTSGGPPSSGGAAPVGGGAGFGGYPTAVAPQESGSREAAAKQGLAVQESGPRVAQTRSSLQTLEELNAPGRAAAGAGADFALRWSKLANQLGLSEMANLSPTQVAETENFKKIVSRIIQQQQQGNPGTNEWLHTYQSGNPDTQMSRLGRGGVIHWLQGNNDAENLIGSRWQEWISRPENQGKQGQYLNWLRSKDGMDIRTFDNRVFQYARMTPEEREKFRKGMTPEQGKSFRQHHEEYDKKGWIKESQGE